VLACSLRPCAEAYARSGILANMQPWSTFSFNQTPPNGKSTRSFVGRPIFAVANSLLPFTSAVNQLTRPAGFGPATNGLGGRCKDYPRLILGLLSLSFPLLN
jgi:hypothetical protein